MAEKQRQQAQRRLDRPVLFVCDIQEKFRGAIWEYEKVILTTQKLLRAATTLSIPLYITTQNRARLGNTCHEITSHITDAHLVAKDVDKTAFSMWIPEVVGDLGKGGNGKKEEIVIVGIESHICVTQTALDALGAGFRVYVIADGVSSCNKQEIPLALDRLRSKGAEIVSSESWLFECLGDAGVKEFKDLSKTVKEYNAKTKATLECLFSSKI